MSEVFGSICGGCCAVIGESIIWSWGTTTSCGGNCQPRCCRNCCTCGFGEGEVEERDEDEVVQPTPGTREGAAASGAATYEKKEDMTVPPTQPPATGATGDSDPESASQAPSSTVAGKTNEESPRVADEELKKHQEDQRQKEPASTNVQG
ncbi:hypothetical protein BT69DRAFT_1275827 [Atractiella rhizophila]|nr:hypothetical protein BT69DRAFT_1275825 [Atractiella rhizophila]KAH8930084.1 hypothetical protein BT69DRAFT_1275827 [Atractiella rhizophila]